MWYQSRKGGVGSAPTVIFRLAHCIKHQVLGVMRAATKPIVLVQQSPRAMKQNIPAHVVLAADGQKDPAALLREQPHVVYDVGFDVVEPWLVAAPPIHPVSAAFRMR